MAKWEYAALVDLKFDFSCGEYNHLDVRSRWILTSSTSSPNFDLKIHSKFKKLYNKWVEAVRAGSVQETGNMARTELNRLLDNDELPNAIITGLKGEDDLDIINRAAAENWETTGRTPGSNQIMMRRRIE